MTDDERYEYEVLSLQTADTHKFAIGIGYVGDDGWHLAFERLMLRDWIRLIDVDVLVVDGKPVLSRVFRVMPEAVEWYVRIGAH